VNTAVAVVAAVIVNDNALFVESPAVQLQKENTPWGVAAAAEAVSETDTPPDTHIVWFAEMVVTLTVPSFTAIDPAPSMFIVSR
jgi:hypothetical protein